MIWPPSHSFTPHKDRGLPPPSTHTHTYMGMGEIWHWFMGQTYQMSFNTHKKIMQLYKIIRQSLKEKAHQILHVSDYSQRKLFSKRIIAPNFFFVCVYSIILCRADSWRIFDVAMKMISWLGLPKSTWDNGLDQDYTSQFNTIRSNIISWNTILRERGRENEREEGGGGGEGIPTIEERNMLSRETLLELV